LLQQGAFKEINMNDEIEILYHLIEAALNHMALTGMNESQYSHHLANAFAHSDAQGGLAAIHGILQSYAEQISRDWSAQADAQPDALPAFVATQACRLLPPDVMSPAAFQASVTAVAEAIPAHDDLSPPAEAPLIETRQVPAAGVCP
jgi:hypothetical protein